jgi:translation initiation factor 5A
MSRIDVDFDDNNEEEQYQEYQEYEQHQEYEEYEEHQEHQEHQEQYDVQQIDTGATESFSIPVNKLRIGGYVIINGKPCRVVSLVKSKIGKHGHSKASFMGIDLFTDKKYEAHMPTSHEIEIPIVTRTEYSLINIDEQYTQLVDIHGNMREDVEIGDDEISENLMNLYQSSQDNQIMVTVLTALGETRIVDFRKAE